MGGKQRPTLAVRDRELVGFRIREAREYAGLGRAELAEALNVHPGSIARWESGGALPQPYYLKRVAELAEVSEAWLRYGEGDRPGREVLREQANDALVTLAALRSFIGEIGAPGTERARKLDALDGYRQLITTREPLPSWWYDLKTLVEKGDL
jgi:transcriptional regulator with XRE-family HTH domain